MISTRRTLDIILINIKINLPKLVNICAYKFATNGQNLSTLSLNENIVFFGGRGATFFIQLIFWQPGVVSLLDMLTLLIAG